MVSVDDGVCVVFLDGFGVGAAGWATTCAGGGSATAGGGLCFDCGQPIIWLYTLAIVRPNCCEFNVDCIADL